MRWVVRNKMENRMKQVKAQKLRVVAIPFALCMASCAGAEEGSEVLETGASTGVGESYDGDADPVALGLIAPDDTDQAPSGEGALTLRADSPAAKILAVATREEGRGPDNVGKDLGRYPYDLGRYLDPGEAWCSEFVSWAYKVAGYPLTGGRQGGWMVESSTSLRKWFQNNSEYVSRGSGSWSTFTPRPGDYIKYNNSGSGHSGIVRYVSGDDLYTVEGNVGNLVKLRRVRDWRGQPNIDGIGRKESSGQSSCNGRCSSSCPCDLNQGDCDSDSECKPGLYCKLRSGTDYCRSR